MSICIVKQYSVFLANEPGALKDFADLFAQENATLLAISSDVRFDAAVVRVAIDQKHEVGHALTKAGFTNVKTDAICIDTPDRLGIARDIGPITTPQISAITAAISPIFTLVFIPSPIICTTVRPLCLREGPKSNFVTISLR